MPSVENSIPDLQPNWTLPLEDYVISMRCSNDSRWIAAAVTEGGVYIIDAENGHIARKLEGHSLGNLCVDWSFDDRFLATSGQDGLAKIWYTQTGELVATIRGDSTWIEEIAWSPHANTLAVSSGKQLILAKLDGTILNSYTPHQHTIAGIQWNRDGSRIASIAYTQLAIWNHTDTDPVETYHWQDALISLSWSPDSKYIACGCQGASVHVWNVFSGNDLQMCGYPAKVKSLSWNSDSSMLATGGSHEISVWDFRDKGPNGKEPIELRSHLNLITQLTFQHHDSVLASSGEDALLLLWKTKKRNPLLCM